jgi:diadenylate cyclase
MNYLEALREMWRWQALIEIPILAMLIYFILRFIEGTRVAGILKALGIVGVLVLFVLALKPVAKLDVVPWLVSNSFVPALVALVIIFQPELRRGLIQLGRSPLFRAFARTESAVVNEIVEAVMTLSRRRIGALIAIQREVGMRGYIERGRRIDAEVSKDLLVTVFHLGTPLHDGAVIIQGNRVAAAGCLFPLSENIDISSGMGTRHRAGVGVTEETDAIAIIVSEETGNIAVAMGGQLEFQVDRDRLRRILRQEYLERSPELEPQEKL